MKKYLINGIDVWARDFDGSVSGEFIAQELGRDCYGIKKINFKPNDIVLDLGANIGLFSIYLAKTNPDIHIYAFEPLLVNYKNLVSNLIENGVKNVTPFFRAITGDGRRVQIATPKNVSGGASLRFDKSYQGDPNLIFQSRADSWTLDEAFLFLGLDRVKLLKIDTEGAEYEILPACHCLYKVEYLSGEFHRNPKKDVGRLSQWCKRFIAEEKFSVEIV